MRTQVSLLLAVFTLLLGGIVLAAPPPKCFDTMFSALEGAHAPDDTASDNISQELMLCIMWEESAFRNIGEVGKPKGAVGFGQVDRSMLSKIPAWMYSKFAKPPIGTANILANDHLSIAVGSAMAKLAMQSKGNVDDALDAYATGSGTSTHKTYWLECERQLKALDFRYYSSSESERESIIIALNEAVQPHKRATALKAKAIFNLSCDSSLK